ncbi:MAG: MATE family efflux transporter [Ignavibacteriae bacterium]|nr:MATE family efflux transporter [Ignavibacteriota bacterium]NOG97023.1 MATE family efflux transporter [Ignavibacteriota bacterium]
MPVAIGQVGHVMFGVVDSLMVGSLGKDPLAAASLVNGIVILILILGLGMSLAATPLIGIAKGKKNNDECGIILRQSLIVNGVFSILLSLLLFFASYFLELLNQPYEVTLMADSYMRIISASIIPFMIFQTYRQFVEGLSFTKPAMYITLAANLINVLGNWIFIHGNLGMPALGLDGAGYSTFLTRGFMAVLMMYFVMNSPRFKEYDPTLKFRSINWEMIHKIIKLGFPIGVAFFFEVGAFSASAVIIGWLGSAQLAAHQIAISIASISFMFIVGIATASTIRVSTKMGEEKFIEMKRAGLSAFALASIFMAFSAILFILLKDFLPTLFISDNEVIPIASSLIVIGALFQISDGIQAVGLGVLRGLTDVKVPMLITFTAYWVIGLPAGGYFAFIMKMGAVGVWIGLLIGLSVAALVLTIRFSIKSNRIKNEH